MAAENRNVTSGPFEIHYTSYGSGEKALVFIHGWTCNSSLWRMQGPLFEQHRSLLIDLPGHGRSSAPDEDYNHEVMARSIHAVVETEHLQQIVLIGHSMGGVVSTMYCRLFPDKVKGIIYVDSFFRSPEHYLTIFQRESLAQSLQESAFRDFFARDWTEKTSSQIREDVVQASLSTPEHVRISAATTNSLPHAFAWDEVYDIPALQVQVKCTVDLIWRHHFPRLEFTTWEGHSHFLFMEDPQRFNTLVWSFLEDNALL